MEKKQKVAENDDSEQYRKVVVKYFPNVILAQQEYNTAVDAHIYNTTVHENKTTIALHSKPDGGATRHLTCHMCES